MHRSRRLLNILFLAALASTALEASAVEAKKVVNVNTADAAKLTMLPRVGSAVADRIVEYRSQNGLFKTPEDLMLVNGVGEKLFNQIKPYVVVSGASTLTDKVRGSGKSGARGKKAASPKKAAAPKSSPKASAPPKKAVSKETATPKKIGAKGATPAKKSVPNQAASKKPPLRKTSH
ncbi:MAG TPA: helix-hairpin-helix domain-containing protein [Thermoanaerobaculia bacterium]|nr:helix-hairpin-helix domain-containing protein [Thermoanaerobaculia bacterium]